jgi:flagellar hook assembly protein FlgD
LAERGKVRLSIYDDSGKQIAVLVDQEHPAGTYETNWDARTNAGTTVSSGVYFARLEQGKLSKTQKLVFIK